MAKSKLEVIEGSSLEPHFICKYSYCDTCKNQEVVNDKKMCEYGSCCTEDDLSYEKKD